MTSYIVVLCDNELISSSLPSLGKVFPSFVIKQAIVIMAIIQGVLPPSRETYELVLGIWKFFPLVCINHLRSKNKMAY